MQKKPFKPTRSCPHRFCKPLHFAVILPGLYFLSQALFDSFDNDTIHLGNYILLIFIGALTVLVIRLVHKGKTVSEIHAEDIASNKGYLIVRTGWARIAVIMDAGVVAVCYAGMWYALAAGSDGTNTVSLFSLLPAISAFVVTITFLEYAHYKATRPAKPKRVPVTAASEA